MIHSKTAACLWTDWFPGSSENPSLYEPFKGISTLLEHLINGVPTLAEENCELRTFSCLQSAVKLLLFLFHYPTGAYLMGCRAQVAPEV